MEVRLGRLRTRPLTVLWVRLAAAPVQVDPPLLRVLRRRMERLRLEHLERNRDLHRPVPILVRIVVQAAFDDGGVLQSICRPRRAPAVVRASIENRTDHVDLDVKIRHHIGRIRTHEYLRTIVPTHRIVPVRIFRPDVRVLTDETYVQVRVVPQHPRERLLLLALRPPGKHEVRQRHRGLPIRFIEDPIHGDRPNRALDRICGQGPRDTRADQAGGDKRGGEDENESLHV